MTSCVCCATKNKQTLRIGKSEKSLVLAIIVKERMSFSLCFRMFWGGKGEGKKATLFMLFGGRKKFGGKD